MILVWVTFACLSLQSPYEDKLPVLQEVSAYAMGMVLHLKSGLTRDRVAAKSDSVCTHVMNVQLAYPCRSRGLVRTPVVEYR